MEDSIFDYTIKTGSRIIVSAPSGAGKSVFILDLISKKEFVFESKIDKVYYVYTIYQPLFEEFASTHSDVVFTSSVPEIPKGNKLNILLVLDDFMLMQESGKDNKEIKDYFIRLSHHLNVTLIVTWQCLFPKNLKMVSLNSSYFIIFALIRDLTGIDVLNRQICPDSPGFLKSIFKELRLTPFSYLVIDNTPQQNEKFRFRNFVYPKIDSKIYIAK